MFSEAVVEHFNIFKHVSAKFALVGKDMTTDGAALVPTIEGLHRRIIVAVALGAHTRLHAKRSQQALVFAV